MTKVKKPVKPFSRLTKAEKRVAIAKDVIDQIKLKTIRIASGEYCTITLDGSVKGKDELQKAFQKGKVKECKVCAMGALFIGDILKRDNFKLNSGNFTPGESGRFEEDGFANVYSSTIEKKLDDYFTAEQLRLIEAAFEEELISSSNTNLRDKNGFETPIVEKAVKFGKKYKTDRGRLIGILENLIKNKGEFIP
jgi:hypothetical protein